MTAALRAAPAPALAATPPGPAALSDAQIHDHLVAAVMDHRLLPGTKLIEAKLGQVYGVSRTRIRQVLIRLAQAQVVTLQPNRGASIAQPSVTEAREVFEVFDVRRLIEPTLIARASQRATPAGLDALAGLIEQEEQARRSADGAAALRLSGEFHLQLAQLAGQATLLRLLQALVSRTSLVLMTYGATATTAATPARRVDACNCRDHRGLLGAMRQGKAAEAQRLMRRHLGALEAALCFELPQPADGDLVALLRDASVPAIPPVIPPKARPRRPKA